MPRISGHVAGVDCVQIHVGHCVLAPEADGHLILLHILLSKKSEVLEKPG